MHSQPAGQALSMSAGPEFQRTTPPDPPDYSRGPERCRITHARTSAIKLGGGSRMADSRIARGTAGTAQANQQSSQLFTDIHRYSQMSRLCGFTANSTPNKPSAQASGRRALGTPPIESISAGFRASRSRRGSDPCPCASSSRAGAVACSRCGAVRDVSDGPSR